MNYAVGCGFNLNEIFYNFDTKKVGLTTKECREYGYEDKITLIKNIFAENVKQILDDIIDNNVTFELPTGTNRKTVMKMRRVEGEEFKKVRQKRKFADVDFLSSNFSGNEIVFEMFYKDGRPFRRKNVYVDKTRKDRITKYTNEGKQYY